MTHPQHVPADAPGFNWQALRARWVEGDEYQPEGTDGEDTRRCYATKAAIAHWLKPEIVGEIGVRAGYSMLAFYMGHPFLEYQGIDANEGGWGGIVGYTDHARALLDTLSLTPDSTIQICDSQRMAELPMHCDLFHVDGDHTFAGALHDIVIALDSGSRFVVVDDYDYIESVKLAADFAAQARGLSARYVSDGGYRGNLVIANDGVEFPA